MGLFSYWDSVAFRLELQTVLKLILDKTEIYQFYILQVEVFAHFCHSAEE